MARIAKKVRDKKVLKLIRRYLQAGIMKDGVVWDRDKGTPQGGPLSPLLSNIMLDAMDKELEKRGLSFCRYADDCNIYVASKRAGERVMACGGVDRPTKGKGQGPLPGGPWSEPRAIRQRHLESPHSRVDSVLLPRRDKAICGRPWTRRKRLMERGLPEEMAVRSAFNQRGSWWSQGGVRGRGA